MERKHDAVRATRFQQEQANAKSVDDYVELVNQALFEIDELVLFAEDEGDGDTEFTAMMPDLRVIEAGLKALHAEILGGGYVIGRGGDLPFMPVVQKLRKRLPIVALIDAINSAHKKGFARD